MGVMFKSLLDSTLSEIVRRAPAYLERFPLGSLDVARMAVRYAKHPFCAKLPPRALEEAFSEGWTYFAKSRAKPEQKTDADDPVTQFLCDSIVDALCADQGNSSCSRAPNARNLSQKYSHNSISNGGQRRGCPILFGMRAVNHCFSSIRRPLLSMCGETFWRMYITTLKSLCPNGAGPICFGAAFGNMWI